jgi:prepilin-type N-terminal cleavage/methylation domain-containing protein
MAECHVRARHLRSRRRADGLLPTELQRSRNGFTLIEVLVVTVIVAVISLAIFSTLDSGLKIWRRVHATSADEDMAIFFLRLGSDVHNAFSYGNQTLAGTSSEVEIPSSEVTPAGTVSVAYDHTARRVCRRLKTRSQTEERADGTLSSCLGDVERLELSYYANATDTQDRVWVDAWRKSELPLAVRVELERVIGQTRTSYAKTVFVPVAVYRHETKKD